MAHGHRAAPSLKDAIVFQPISDTRLRREDGIFTPEARPSRVSCEELFAGPWKSVPSKRISRARHFARFSAAPLLLPTNGLGNHAERSLQGGVHPVRRDSGSGLTAFGAESGNSLRLRVPALRLGLFAGGTALLSKIHARSCKTARFARRSRTKVACSHLQTFVRVRLS